MTRPPLSTGSGFPRISTLSWVRPPSPGASGPGSRLSADALSLPWSLKHFSHLPSGVWAHLLSPLGRQPHGHRDATPPCPRPVAHPPCLLGTAQGGLSRSPERVVTRTTRNGPGPHLGHPPLNSLAGQDLGTVTGRPGNPLRGPPDKSQIKFTELPGRGGRLEFTPRERTKNAPCSDAGHRESDFRPVQFNATQGPRGRSSPPWPTRELWAPRGGQRRSLAEPPAAGTRPFCPYPAPAPAPAWCLHLPLRCWEDRHSVSGDPGHWEVGSGRRSVPSFCTWSSGSLWSCSPGGTLEPAPQLVGCSGEVGGGGADHLGVPLC